VSGSGLAATGATGAGVTGVGVTAAGDWGDTRLGRIASLGAVDTDESALSTALGASLGLGFGGATAATTVMAATDSRFNFSRCSGGLAAEPRHNVTSVAAFSAVANKQHTMNEVRERRLGCCIWKQMCFFGLKDHQKVNRKNAKNYRCSGLTSRLLCRAAPCFIYTQATYQHGFNLAVVYTFGR
jgi:hypothetical protein